MAKERKGSLIVKKGRLYARITFVDDAGKRRELYQRVETKTEGRDWLRDKLKEVDERGEAAIEGDKKTFADLAKAYREAHLHEVQTHNGRKVSGLRSLETPSYMLDTLVQYFNQKQIKTITHADIKKYRKERLNAPVIITYKENGEEKTRERERPRSITSVNRELEVLRSALNFAVRQGWLPRNPFTRGEPLISKAHEERRTRILSFEEEEQLQAACETVSKDNRQRWAHLRPIIIAALDTGCRRGELFQLRWSDVNIEKRAIHIRFTTTKTERARVVPISSRLLNELLLLHQEAKSDAAKVFEAGVTVKHSWKAVCHMAGIDGLRFHDLRATFISRLLQQGLSAAEVMRLSGHTTLAALNHYVRVDSSSLDRAIDALDSLHRKQIEPDRPALVN